MPTLMYPGGYLSALAASNMPQRPLRLKCFSGRYSGAALTAVQYSSAFMHMLLFLVERLGSHWLVSCRLQSFIGSLPLIVSRYHLIGILSRYHLKGIVRLSRYRK